MMMKKILSSLLIALGCLLIALPVQAAMVTTSQLQHSIPSSSPDLTDIGEKRDWIREQLVIAGVSKQDASIRVGAMTDVQVAGIHQRIDQEPAGGNAILVVLLILVITDVMGVTDIFPFIRPVNK